MKVGLQIFGVALSLGLLTTGCVTKPNSDGLGGYGTSRTLPERMTDFGIQRNVVNGLGNIVGVSEDNVRVVATSFRGDVLLTGEVPSAAIKEQIGTMALSIREVNELFNYLEVADTPKSQSHTNHERYLQSKIIARLLSSSLKPTQYKIVVRSDVAYVMGEMTKEQQDAIVDSVRNTEGIRGVVLANKLLTSQASQLSGVAGAVPPSVEDTSAVYPTYGSQAHQSANTYMNSGYPASMYTTGGEPSIQPQTEQGQSSSGYVQRYQGTNNP